MPQERQKYVMRFLKLIGLLILATAISSCSSSTTLCEPYSIRPVPGELTQPLEPLRLAVSPDDIQDAYIYNMERVGICYSQYNGLSKAVRDREAAQTKGMQ